MILIIQLKNVWAGISISAYSIYSTEISSVLSTSSRVPSPSDTIGI